MSAVLKPQPASRRERERLDEALRLAHWSHERAEQLARTALLDVALDGVRAVRRVDPRGGKR